MYGVGRKAASVAGLWVLGADAIGFGRARRVEVGRGLSRVLATVGRMLSGESRESTVLVS